MRWTWSPSSTSRTLPPPSPDLPSPVASCYCLPVSHDTPTRHGRQPDPALKKGWRSGKVFPWRRERLAAPVPTGSACVVAVSVCGHGGGVHPPGGSARSRTGWGTPSGSRSAPTAVVAVAVVTATPRSEVVPVTLVPGPRGKSVGMAVVSALSGFVGVVILTTARRDRGMGINFGPPPVTPPTPSPEERNPFFPDTTDDPHVARCSGCLREFTADQYVALPQEENLTVCSSCGNEVMFL